MLRARSRLTVEVDQWDGSEEEARRLGLALLRVVHAPGFAAWHLSTPAGLVVVATGDWLVTHGDGHRELVRRGDFSQRFELL